MKHTFVALIVLILVTACALTPPATPISTVTSLSTGTGLPTATRASTPTSTITLTPTPTISAWLATSTAIFATVIAAPTRTPAPTATPTPSWEQLYGPPQLIWRSPTRLVIGGDLWTVPGYNEYVFRIGGTISEVKDPELGDVFEYRVTEDRSDVRIQMGKSGPPIEPPYSITVKVKLGDTFNISSGGGVNFISAFRDVSNPNAPTLIAGIDFGYRLTGNLKVKMPPSDNPDKKGNPGNNYKQYSGYTPLRKGVWEIIEFRVDGNDMLEYWLNGSLEARGLSYLAEKGAQGDNLVSMHAGNIYGSKIAKDSVIWRGPVEIRKFNAMK